MVNYTKIPEDFKKKYLSKFEDKTSDEINRLAEEDPVIFAYYFLNTRVRLHQAYVMHKIITSKTKRIALCWARQLGKSIDLGIFLTWATWYNKFPATVSKITTSYIISTTDESSMELLGKVREIILQADMHMEKTYGIIDYFASNMKEPNNTHQITWKHGDFIKSVPPTNKVLGKSASIMIIDEAANLDNEDPDKFYEKVVSPTVDETGGFIILSSTPEGPSGFFYDEFNPDGKNDDTDFERTWFSFEIFKPNEYDITNKTSTQIRTKFFEYEVYMSENKGNWTKQEYEIKLDELSRLKYCINVIAKKEKAEREGKFNLWQQQRMALFTVTQTSFFEPEDIEYAKKNTPQEYEWDKTPCSVAYDYGTKIARTAITIRTKIGKEIIQLFQYRGIAGFNNNLLNDPKWEHSFQRLKQRYNLQWAIGDDCPGGDSHNRWLKDNSGIDCTFFNFRSDQMSKNDGLNRNCTWYAYRSAMKKNQDEEGRLRIPVWNKRQLIEMMLIQETEQKVLITIKAPVGQLCDTVDSDMMASIPFLDMTSVSDIEFDTPDIDDVEEEHGQKYDYFHSPSDDECREMIKQANEDDIR